MSIQNPVQPAVTPLNPDKILTQPDEWQREMLGNVGAVVGSALNQQASATYEALASSAKHLSRSDPKVAPIWDKYSAEIEALANSPAVNPAIRGTKEFWDQATKVVQAQHIDDLVQERAAAMAAELRPTAETGAGSYGASDPDTSTSMEKLKETTWGKRLVDRYGERGVLKNIEKLGVTLEQYAKMAGETNVIVNPNNPAEWWNRDLMRGV